MHIASSSQRHACSWHVLEASERCKIEVKRGRKATQRESMRVQGSCRAVAVCPVCVLPRAGTDTMEPAVLAGVAQACLVTERHTERGGAPRVQRSRPVRVDCCVTNVSLQHPSAAGPLSSSNLLGLTVILLLTVKPLLSDSFLMFAIISKVFTVPECIHGSDTSVSLKATCV